MDINEESLAKEKEFIEFIRGKRVCVVGSAPTLEDKNQAEIIDGYDVVIRMNENLYRADKLNKDYGYRNDVYYTNTANYEFGLSQINKLKEKNIKWLVFKSQGDYRKYTDKDKINCMFINGGVNLNMNMGCITVEHLVNFEVASEIYVTAYSFYKGKKYYDGILDCTNITEAEKQHHLTGLMPDGSHIACPHNIGEYIDTFKRLVSEDKIKLDEWGTKYLFE